MRKIERLVLTAAVLLGNVIIGRAQQYLELSKRILAMTQREQTDGSK